MCLPLKTIINDIKSRRASKKVLKDNTLHNRGGRVRHNLPVGYAAITETSRSSPREEVLRWGNANYLHIPEEFLCHNAGGKTPDPQESYTKGRKNWPGLH